MLRPHAPRDRLHFTAHDVQHVRYVGRLATGLQDFARGEGGRWVFQRGSSTMKVHKAAQPIQVWHTHLSIPADYASAPPLYPHEPEVLWKAMQRPSLYYPHLSPQSTPISLPPTCIPTSPLPLKVLLKAVQLWAQWYCVRTRVYSRECMPLPGPPEEKELPATPYIRRG